MTSFVFKYYQIKMFLPISYSVLESVKVRYFITILKYSSVFNIFISCKCTNKNLDFEIQSVFFILINYTTQSIQLSFFGKTNEIQLVYSFEN